MKAPVTAALLVLACGAPSALALTENYVPTPGDYVFYTFALTVAAFSAVLIFSYREFQWLVYTVFSFLLILNAAAMDGTLAYLLGPTDFVIWVIPFLVFSSVAAYGYMIVAWRIEEGHRWARYRPLFRRLALVTAVFPLTSYFWLMRIPLNWMWVPVEFLFFFMTIAQVLPPLTWHTEDRWQRLLTRLFPVMVAISVSVFYANIVLAGLSQAEKNFNNRLLFSVFGVFSLAIVIRQAFNASKARDEAEKRALEAARNEAETQLALLNAERDYENARQLAARSRSQLATVSHDLKQPVSALRAAIERMQQLEMGEGTEKLARAIDYIDELARAYIEAEDEEALAGFDNEEYAQVSHERTEAVPASLFCGTLRQMFSDEAQRHGVELRIVESSGELEVEPLSAMRVMNNLVSNAIAHSGAARVLVGFRRREGALEFQVHDNGRGMPGREAENPVVPEVRLESAGHGLGLGIVSQLCEEAGQRFSLDSTPGCGTSARVAFPLVA